MLWEKMLGGLLLPQLCAEQLPKTTNQEQHVSVKTFLQRGHAGVDAERSDREGSRSRSG